MSGTPMSTRLTLGSISTCQPSFLSTDAPGSTPLSTDCMARPLNALVAGLDPVIVWQETNTQTGFPGINQP